MDDALLIRPAVEFCILRIERHDAEVPVIWTVEPSRTALGNVPQTPYVRWRG
jgi:hypothetical protein